MSYIIEPDGYVSEHTGVISDIRAFNASDRLMEVEFSGGEVMLFPLARQLGGKWRYELGLRPKMAVSAAWKDNPSYIEGDPTKGPRAFFTIAWG